MEATWLFRWLVLVGVGGGRGLVEGGRVRRLRSRSFLGLQAKKDGTNELRATSEAGW